MYYDRLNELIYKCTRYGIKITNMEYNITFVMGVHKEWRSVSLMIKTQHGFDFSTLNDVYNQLKTHEAEVTEMVEESRINLGGPLALVSKVTGREIEKEVSENEGSDEEGLIIDSDDEAITFYSNNKVMKFYKKSFNAKMNVGLVSKSITILVCT